MSNVDLLDVAEVNSQFLLDTYLESIRNEDFGPGACFVEVGFRYQILGAIALLKDADVDRFVDCLARSAQCDLEFRKLAPDHPEFDPRYLVASRSRSFSVALAIGDLQTATALAGVMPTEHCPEIEYEDDFLRFSFLHCLVADSRSPAELEGMLERWSDVVDGDPAPHLAVSKALLSLDQHEFDRSFDEVVHGFVDESDAFSKRIDYVAELGATDRAINTHGLALLRIAMQRGLETQRAYSCIPSLAIVPSGAPLPESGAWRLSD